jgi:hypothetical protein
MNNVKRLGRLMKKISGFNGLNKFGQECCITLSDLTGIDSVVSKLKEFYHETNYTDFDYLSREYLNHAFNLSLMRDDVKAKETNEKYPLSFAVKHNLQVDLEQSQSAMDNLQDFFEHASKPLEVYMAIKGVLNEEYRLKQVMVDVLEDITNQIQLGNIKTS